MPERGTILLPMRASTGQEPVRALFSTTEGGRDEG